jgi:hypothetical protein
MPSISNIHTEYTEADKAQWILEHGQPRFVWIYERVDDKIYRKPMSHPETNLPPWMSQQRELVQRSGEAETQHKGEYYE